MPAGAGMYYLNHWIPAFACLQQAGRNDGGAVVRHLPGMAEGLSG